MPNLQFPREKPFGINVRYPDTLTRMEQVLEFIGRFIDISTFTEKLRISSLLVSLSFFSFFSPLFLNSSGRSTNLPPVARNANQFPINKVTRNVASFATQPRIFTKIDITLPVCFLRASYGLHYIESLCDDRRRQTNQFFSWNSSIRIPPSFFLPPLTRTRGTGGEKRRWKKKWNSKNEK